MTAKATPTRKPVTPTPGLDGPIAQLVGLPVYHLGEFNHHNHLFPAVLDENDHAVFWTSSQWRVLLWLDDELHRGKCAVMAGVFKR